jgi:hypothetical protein
LADLHAQPHTSPDISLFDGKMVAFGPRAAANRHGDVFGIDALERLSSIVVCLPIVVMVA